MIRLGRIIIFFVIGLIISKNVSFASVEINGMIESNVAIRLREDNEYMKMKNQIRLKVEHQTSNIKMFGSIDVWNDILNNSVYIDLNEAFIDMSFNTINLRMGKQKMTWGKTDGIILTDILNPRDWTEFLSNSYEDLKIPITACKINYYNRNFDLEGLFIPIFVPNKFASSGDWVFYNPFPSTPTEKPIYPEANLKNSEVGLKVSKFDYSLSYFEGWNNSPTMHFNSGTITPKYHRIQNIGFETDRQVFNNILRVELLYANTEDDEGTDYAINNPCFTYMIGLERTLRGDLTLNFQFIQERMMRYDEYVSSVPMEFKREDKIKNTFTVDIRDMWVNQTIRPQIWAIYNEFNKDYFIRFNVEQDIADGVSYTAGVDIYEGKDNTTLYGQFEKNDYVYGKVRYSF